MTITAGHGALARRAPQAPGDARKRPVSSGGWMFRWAVIMRGSMAATALSHAYPLGTRVNERGHLEVGGCDVVELAERYGTPGLHLRRGRHPRAGARVRGGLPGAHRRLRGHLRLEGAADHRRLPADGARRGCRWTSPPAASSTSRCAAGVEPQRLFMHGNNKTEAELRAGLRRGIGYLVLDSFEEIDRAERLLEPARRTS